MKKLRRSFTLTHSERREIILVFHSTGQFITAQRQEIADHVWIEMEKLNNALESYGLSFADLGAGFGKSIDEIKLELSNCFAYEWIMKYGNVYRTYHWETVHEMPEEVRLHA
ncbi:MAG: hypothetical protein Q8Q23_00910 [bacterium]|nr:hypothetical protein [bacterium]